MKRTEIDRSEPAVLFALRIAILGHESFALLGGAKVKDRPSNLQWQTVAEAKKKVRQCRMAVVTGTKCGLNVVGPDQRLSCQFASAMFDDALC